MKFGIILILLSLTACPPPPPPIIKPVSVEPIDTSSCAAACKKLQDLKCEEGRPLEDGTSCEKFCIDTQQSGHALRPSCIIEKVQKCSDIQPFCFERR